MNQDTTRWWAAAGDTGVPAIAQLREDTLSVIIGRADDDEGSFCEVLDPNGEVRLIPLADFSKREATIYALHHTAPSLPIRIGETALAVSTPWINLGHSKPFGRRHGQLVFENHGLDDVVIDSLSPSCNCVSASLDREMIPPDGSATVKVDVSMANQASFKQQVHVTLRDRSSGTSKRLSFDIFASQMPTMGISPTLIDFGTVAAGETIRRTVTLVEADGDPFEVLQVDSDLTGLAKNIEASALSPGLRIHRINLEFTPDDWRSGDFQSRVRIITTSKRFPEARIAARGTVRPFVGAVPSLLSFGTPRLGETVTKGVTLMMRDGRAFSCSRIKLPRGVSIASDRLRLPQVLKNGHELTFEAAFDQTGSYEGVIELLGADDNGQSISIPCVALVLPPPTGVENDEQ